jgi:hypothetical protein
MPTSTPLDQLAGDAGSPDEERVKRILAEMNATGSIQAPPSIMQQPAIINEPPVAISTGQLRMDPGTARANVIGNSIPSMADFQAMLAQAPPGMAPFHGPMAVPNSGPLPKPPAPTSDIRSAILKQLRGPLAVAIVVFFLNMPVITSVLSRYASWMYLSSGEISIGGLFIKALLAAMLFAVYQGVSSFFDGDK